MREVVDFLLGTAEAVVIYVVLWTVLHALGHRERK